MAVQTIALIGVAVAAAGAAGTYASVRAGKRAEDAAKATANAERSNAIAGDAS